jgi:alkane 1-monooxygenase
VASNILLFHLQRHSDHHYHASRRYQSLRHFDDAPQLPSGYVGMLLLADVPILWHKVIDPKTLALVDGDLSKLNVDPSILD